MTDPRPQIDDAELHAFVDGRLDSERRRAVEAYLAAHPDMALMVDDYRALNAGMHSLYDAVLSEPIPARLRSSPTKRPTKRWRMILPTALALAAGLLLGWFGRDVVGGQDVFTRSLVGEALAAHQIFALDSDHPLEVSANPQGRVLTWLKYRLGEDVAPPDLTKFGYVFQGARAMPGLGGPAVQLTYRDRQGARITLLIARVERTQREVSVRRQIGDGLAAIFWIDEGFACAMVGSVDAAELLDAAESAYRQLTDA